MSTNKVARLSNFVKNIINKKSYEPARAFRDLWSFESSQIALAPRLARAIWRTFKT